MHLLKVGRCSQKRENRGNDYVLLLFSGVLAVKCRCVSGGWRSHWLSWCVTRGPAGTAGLTEAGWDAETWIFISLSVLSSVVWSGGWWLFLFCCPAGYSGQDFDWADYQKQCGAEAAPHLCFRNVSSSFCSCPAMSNKTACTEKGLKGFEGFLPEHHEASLGKKLGESSRFPKREKNLL